jgi:hypothetical protein
VGTSKIVAGAGVYVIIGLYALGFNSADQAVYNIGQSEAYHDQARQIANVGMRFAMGDMGSSSNPALPFTSNSNLIGGSVSYTGDRPAGLAASQVRVTSLSTYNGYHVTIVAILQWTGVKWTVQRVYQQMDAAEYSRLS